MTQVEAQALVGPNYSTERILAHIRKELREIEAEPRDLEEWIDVVLLALDGAWRAGYSPEQIVRALVDKHSKNETRTWPDWRAQAPDKPIEHVKPPVDELPASILAELKHVEDHAASLKSCPSCGGDGYYHGPRLGDEMCPLCGGTGMMPA